MACEICGHTYHSCECTHGERDAYRSGELSAQAEIASLHSEVERLHSEYKRGVDAMANNLWRFAGSVKEAEVHEDHNDAVLAARIKALANADGKLNMTIGQSEVYVEGIRDTAHNDALEEAAKSVEYSWGMSVSDAVAAIRALKRPTS